MPLRKSPRRTRALLAANRRNSRKSTGPRTAAGKRHSAWNAVRHGRRARASCRCIPRASRDLKTFMDFYFKLDDAIIPANSLVGQQTVLDKALEVWKVKRLLDRWIETRTEEDWQGVAAGATRPPSYWRLRLRRPGVSVPDWTVTISVWLRWGRGPGQSGGRSRPSTPPDQDNDRASQDRPRLHMAKMAMPRTPRMHTMVSVHSTGPRNVARASRPCGPWPGLALSNAKGWPCHEHGEPDSERTKPEYKTLQRGCGDVSVPADWDPAYAEAYALAGRLVGWFMRWGKRTKPEYDRKQAAYKNMSAASASGGRNSNGSREATSLGTRLAKVFRAMKAMKTALIPRKKYSQLPMFQTKPECKRKEGAYKNMSKTPGWLMTAASSLFKREPNQQQLICPVGQPTTVLLRFVKSSAAGPGHRLATDGGGHDDSAWGNSDGGTTPIT